MKHESPDEPWTEAQWEAFMKRADLRSARFGELLETLHDDPDKHAKIDHEMGWDAARRKRECDAEDDFDPADYEPDEQDLAEAGELIKESDRALRRIAAYSFALRAERQVRKIIRPHLEKPASNDDDEQRWQTVWMGPAMAGAKIAGGHGMGYDEDVLCGNIVNVRRGLAAVNKALAAAKSLQTEKLLAPADAKKLLQILNQLKEKVEAWIKELRSRVWWE